MKRFLKQLITLLLICGFILPLSVFSQNAAATRFRPSEKAWKFADKQLKKLTLDEKVGQLVHTGINARYFSQDSAAFQELKRQVVEDKVGGILLFAGPIYESVHLMNRMQENAKIPLLIGMDAETGVGMRFFDAINFPWNMAVTATGDPELARRMGIVTGREARALGIHQVYAPTLDVNNNADNPVINVRSYGENPQDVARFGAAFIEGMQSQRVIATAKHFPGHGDTNVDSHRGLPIINLPRERFDRIELPPFKKAIESGVASIMVAHISLPQIDPTEILPLKQAIKPVDADEGAEIVMEKATVPATLSPVVNRQILRKELGFDGLIVTDSMGMSGLTLYATQEEAGVRALEAGADLLLKPADHRAMIKGIKDALKSGRLTEGRIDESVRKLLAWKYELGLFKEKITPLDQIDRIVSNQEAAKLSDEIAEKAVTLVKNEGGVLPLAKGKKVFLLTITNGDDGVLTATPLKRTLSDNGVKFTEVVLDGRSTAADVQRAMDALKVADAVIAPLFGRVRSGQARSIGLPDAGVKVLREAFNTGKPVVNIAFGNPYLLKEFPEMKTYVVGYGDMASLQRAAGRAIYGVSNFTGKLPINITAQYQLGSGLSLR